MVERQNLKRGGKAIKIEEVEEKETNEDERLEVMEDDEVDGLKAQSKKGVAIKTEIHPDGANFYSALSSFQFDLAAGGDGSEKVLDEEEKIRNLFNVRDDDVKVGWRNETTEEADMDAKVKVNLSNVQKVKVVAKEVGKLNGDNCPKLQNVEKVKVTPGGNSGKKNHSWTPMSPELPGLFFTVKKPLKRKLTETRGKTGKKSTLQKIKKGKSESILREKPIAFDFDAPTQMVGETWCFKFMRYSGE